MQTQLTCPACKTPFMADIFQVVDVGLQPELKQMLLTGALNVVQCPSCGTATRVGTPFLYHDPAHELFMVYVPIELSMAQNEQEKLIGQLVTQAMDQLPPEQRRGYMLQPQTILSLQTLIEKVLETEGVTREMLDRQRAQSELLQQLMAADRATTNQIIADRQDEFDEQFFAMLNMLMESAEQSGQDEALLKLVNLRAALYQKTEYGKRLEAQQLALHKLNRDAKQAGGVSPELLLKHVLANRKDPATVDALISASIPAFNYEFFMLLSEKIDKRQQSGIDAGELIALRESLLDLQEALTEQSRKLVEQASGTLQAILSAADTRQAVREHLPEIDDGFMYVLSARIRQAQEQGDQQQEQALMAVYEAISQEMDSQLPPEIQLLNEVLSLESEEEQVRLLEARPEFLTPDFLELVQAVSDQAAESGRDDLKERLARLQTLITARMAS